MKTKFNLDPNLFQIQYDYKFLLRTILCPVNNGVHVEAIEKLSELFFKKHEGQVGLGVMRTKIAYHMKELKQRTNYSSNN